MDANAVLHANHEIFVHIRILIGMILGLSVARLVSGAVRYIQHPGRDKIYSVHLAWVICIFLFIINFWWFEFALSRTPVWTFGLYFLVIFYTIVFVSISTMLFPDQLQDSQSIKEYFLQRRTAFYILLLVLFVVDVLDTLYKGQAHFQSYGIAYPIRQALLILGAAGGLMMRSQRYDTIYVSLVLASQIIWIAVLFNVMSV